MFSFVFPVFISCDDHVPSALEKYSNLRAKDTEAIVKMSERLDGGFFSFVFPLIVDSILNKIAPSIFSPNTIRSLQNFEKTFTQIKRRWDFILFFYVKFLFVLFSLVLFFYVLFCSVLFCFLSNFLVLFT